MRLKSKGFSEYRGDYNSAVLEQWKTCVEMANSNTEKRNTANSIFITINSAILAVVTFSLDYPSMLLSIVGIVICALWIRTVKSYAQLSKVKYDIINKIEKYLPMQPHTYEWQELQKTKYVGLTTIEKLLPIVFIILFSVAILSPIIKESWPYIKNIICQQ